MKSTRTRGTCLACLVLLAAAGWAAADFSNAFKYIDPAVVTISAGEKTGSGFIVAADGYIVTNRHVVDGTESAGITVKLQNDEALTATVQHSSDSLDISVLKVDASGLPVAQFASSDTLTSGQDVAAIGAPLGLEHSVTRGVVSSTSRELEGNTYIQIDAALNEGNSGGPVINGDGQVVGVAVKIADEAQNVGFAIPSTEVMRFLRDNNVSFTAALGAMPAAEADQGAVEEPSAAGPEAGAEAVPSPERPSEPEAELRMPKTWIIWPVLISFFVSALTALVVTMALGRRGPAAMAAVPGRPQAAGTAPHAQPPAPRVEEDLSDIDIDLH